MNFNDIYKGQTKLEIILNTSLDLTGVSTSLIKYRKPSGETGEWVASIVDTVKGIIRYIVQSSTDIDETGLWVLWAHVTYPDTTTIIGKPTEIFVKNEGEI